MSESNPESPARNFSVLGIALIVILALVLVSLFVISNLGAPPSKTPFGPVDAAAGPEGAFNQVANDFFLDLKDGRLDEAYGRTSKEFQQRLSVDKFRDLMIAHPFPGPPGSVGTFRKEDAERGVWVYTFHGAGPNGQLAFSFEVGREGNQHRVTAFTIE